MCRLVDGIPLALDQMAREIDNVQAAWTRAAAGANTFLIDTALPEPSTERARRLLHRYSSPRGEAVHTELEAIARTTGESMAAIARSWVLHNPDVTSAIVGVRSKRHLRDAVRASNLVLTNSHLQRLHAASSLELAGGPALRRQLRHRGRKHVAAPNPLQSWPHQLGLQAPARA